MFSVAVLVGFVFVVSCFSQNPDKISYLPYLKGELGSQYSGYIQVDSVAGRNFHYWFVECETNPASAPLVLWLNGGPGCSSLDGFFYEHGPFKFDPTSTKPLLIPNPYSWNKLANMLYLESPAGVGFSYSNSQDDYLHQNDTRTANDNYKFLKLWFQKYPQYLKNDFWITGESYAGAYVPLLAQNVVNGIRTKDLVIPFKGIMVGNGVSNSVGADEVTVYINFLAGHGIISHKAYLAIEKYCTSDPNSAACSQAKQSAYDNMNGIDIYDIYTDCYHQRPSLGRTGKLEGKVNVGLVPPCTDAFFGTQYLALPEVKSAIHVNPSVEWSICNELVNIAYDRTSQPMPEVHKFLLSKGIRVFIFSGDADFAVPYTDSEYWTSNEMGLTPTSSWRQWYFDDDEGQQVAGFVTEYGSNFSFATIRGAGHMVPQFAPLPAYAMFERVLSGKPL